MNVRNNYSKSVTFLIAISFILLAFTSITIAAPGEDDNKIGPSAVLLGSLVPVVNETGNISWSIDGLGTNGSLGVIQVEKPAGATVRSAFMGAASTGFNNRMLNAGDVSIDGAGVTWDISTPSSISSWNHWADVTEMVKPKIDAAAAGRIDFIISEVNPSGIDGEILVVIFDDPNQTSDNTLALFFGAQDIDGDDFFVSLADPLDLSDPNLVLDMSLGISYGYQGVGQVSNVDVNGSRLTSSAGGQDDGAGENGALLTVGGLDDTNANPSPFASPSSNGFRTDDELYDLKPFVSEGDVLISVHSINPSDDDNIFFAGFFLTVKGTIVDIPPVNGHIFGAVTNNSNGMLGVPVTLYDAADEEVSSAYTDETGYYEFTDVSPGDYTVGITTPLGFVADNELQAVTVSGGSYEVNFELLEGVAEKLRHIWWWKVYLKDLREDGPRVDQFTEDDVNLWLQKIFDHYYSRTDGY